MTARVYDSQVHKLQYYNAIPVTLLKQPVYKTDLPEH